ncbi:hypothetical protein FMEXI_9926 [Fusarium mexicanum]|uniref:Uncharacterized protein n=1 Tax=Fusarium mexicanum TaxID=751941 RepID=A0A8H5IIX1_9HYPO|nr:hypothetical protein FMEXI_9926 [Fusarium mexicanum]
MESAILALRHVSRWFSKSEGFTYAFARAAMAQKIAVVLLSNADLGTSDDRSGQSSSKKVSVLIDGIALDCSEDDLLDEPLLKVFDDHALQAESEGLLFNSIEVLNLTNIGEATLKYVSLNL